MAGKEKLAVHGGPRLIPPGTIKPWPPIEVIDRRMVLDSLNGEIHTSGVHCQKFQEEFAAWNGNRFAINTNSGTAALHMAVAACGCGVGDEVIVPAYTWSSSATCALHHDAIPVFVDINWETMNIDPEKIEAAISENTRAIIAVHLHGLSVDMERVMAVAARHGLKVIEDGCQSHGATFRGRKVGTWGHANAFSFNQNKCLCSGDGGMFVTDDEDLYLRARQVWSFGETRTPMEDRDYHAYALGWMYRGNDMLAAFGRAQLTRLDHYLEVQRRNAARLTAVLEGTPGVILPTEPPDCWHTYYNYTIRLDMEALGHADDAAAFRNKFVKALQAEGADRGVGPWQRWILPAMTVFQARNAYGHGHPWSHPRARPVDYSPDQFPLARRHADWSFGMTYPLRAPNSPDVAEQVGLAIRKLIDNIDDVDRVDVAA